MSSSSNTGPAPLAVAKIDTEIMTDMFNRMSTMCFKKCVARQHESDLQVGEMACVDRCTAKYMQAGEQVTEQLAKFEGMVKAQEATGVVDYRPKH